MTLNLTKRQRLNLAILLSLLIFTSGCFLQPVNKVIREFNFIDMDAPAVRLARPVEAEILIWEESSKKWVPAGKGLIPAGAYIKGRAPGEEIN